MIPKVIHYCWFGRSEYSKVTKKCISSWKEHCADYEIKEWNEDNFDVQSNIYIKQAYEAKKYAFVSDYARLLILYTCGGIYMDTDVELVRSLDEFLNQKAFLGFELFDAVQTSIMAGEQYFHLFEEFLKYYKDKQFVKPDGSFDTTTNVEIITNILRLYGLKLNGTFQIISGLVLYPQDYFCPFDNSTGMLRKTSNTAAIHWFQKSWMSPLVKMRLAITRPIHRVFGVNCFDWLKKIINR